MKINKLTASFGKLENETLSFHEGLNVIYAPNESGKTTWCAFIQAMLYGVDSSERARAGYLPDKQRYAPWSGAPMEGSMELTADGCDITITRMTRAKSAPMKEFTAVYTGTNTPVDGMTGQNAGELLTGVTKDVFRRTAFVGQGAVAVTGSPDLEKRISAIVSTGEEQSSFSEADERLRAWQRKRRYNRRGMLPELEGKMDDVQRRLDDMGSSVEDVQRLEKQLEKKRADCARLEQAVTESRKRQRRDALERLNAGRNELQRASDRHDEAMAELSRRREELRKSDFGELSREELRAQVEADREELQALEQRRKTGSALWPAILCFVLAVVGAAVYTWKPLLPLMIAAGVFCAAAVVLMLRYSKARQAAIEAQDRKRLLLRRYRASSSSELARVLEQREALEDAAAEAERAEQESRTAYEQTRRKISSLEESAVSELDFAGGDTEAARLSRALTVSRTECEHLSAQIASLNGRLSAMGDPLVLASSLSCLRDEYEQIQEEFDAITMAEDALRDADSELQRRFSPELGRLAAQYMSEVTGGRYEDVLINRDFSARARTKGDAVARDSEYLSAGTLDLMYLAVRLAVCELALPDGEPCPLVIDDALVNLDEKRFLQAMTLLKQIARDRQVLLFTCRQS